MSNPNGNTKTHLIVMAIAKLAREGKGGNLEPLDRALKENPESIDAVNDDGMTAMAIACEHMLHDVINRLARAGATKDIDKIPG